MRHTCAGGVALQPGDGVRGHGAGRARKGHAAPRAADEAHVGGAAEEEKVRRTEECGRQAGARAADSGFCASRSRS
eukprot:6209976-Pleurochrysis_carterae.AAC.2